MIISINKFIIIITIIFAFSFFAVSAQAMESNQNITVEIIISESFSPGETINFSYRVLSQTKIDLKIIPSIDCELDLPQPIPDIIDINLNQNEPYSGKYKGIEIVAEFPYQKCEAIVSIVKPARQSFKKEFIINTLPKINMKFLFCSDEKCGNEQKNFTINNNVYINISTRQKYPVIADIVLPNGEKEILQIPSWYIFRKSGDYKFQFNFKEPGFQEINKIKVITVDDVESDNTCYVDSKCLSPETPQNCPQDCIVPTKPKPEPKITTLNKKFFLAIVMIIIIISIIMIYYFLIRKKMNNDDVKNGNNNSNKD